MNDEPVKRPVRYDREKGYIFDRDRKIVVDAHIFRGLSDPITEHIALALNEYPDQAARISELEAEVERLREANQLLGIQLEDAQRSMVRNLK